MFELFTIFGHEASCLNGFALTININMQWMLFSCIDFPRMEKAEELRYSRMENSQTLRKPLSPRP